jgi:hypothetical protein
LKALAARFSREDLLRAFDLLTQAEAEIRTAAQPRYNLEMALLRWIHLRKLVPIEDLIAGVESGSGSGRTSKPKPAAPVQAPPPAQKPAAPARSEAVPDVSRAAEGSFKDALLGEIKKSKAVFYNMVVAQAQKIEGAGDRITFTFAPIQRTLCDTVEQNRAWLEGLAERIAGRKIAVVVVQGEAAARADASPSRDTGAGPTSAGAAAKGLDAGRKSALREQALADTSVQALLEVFPAEIRDVEEM